MSSQLFGEWLAPLFEALFHEELDPLSRELLDEVESILRDPLSPPDDVFEDAPRDPQPPEEG